MLKLTVTTETFGRAWEDVGTRIKTVQNTSRPKGSIGSFRAMGQPAVRSRQGSRQSGGPPVRQPPFGWFRTAGARGAAALPAGPALPGSSPPHRLHNWR